ncbi:PDZ and LIM domain protein 2 isoform X7 [Myotis myotis]|uniref:PDZ and LIM domain protein 2 isoform X7 n=1 Tax=Myotis myotis TaxID=51298 RepID=UPI00174EB8CF|nr:PDZ and LIM domain protein 2 isoform X7 [Myotis myotis]
MASQGMALTVDVMGPAPWGFRITGGRDFHTPIMVTKVTERGKAQAADLRPGDIIVAINGEDAQGMLHAEAQSKIRQSPSPLRLQLDRSRAASPGQTNGESAMEVLATRFQGSVRTHTDSQSSLRSSCSSPPSLSPQPCSPFSTQAPTSPRALAGEAVMSRSSQSLAHNPGLAAADRLSYGGHPGRRQAGLGLAGDSAVLVLPPSPGPRPSSPRLSMDSERGSHVLREDSEVFKMLQENREGRMAPRQSSSFKLLQEALEAEERGGAGEKLAGGCVVPGVTSSYRRIPDACGECSSDSWEGDGELKGLRTQVPLPKLAFLDSGVEMAVGDSSWAISPRLSQDSLDSEPVGSPEPLALPMEPSAHLGRLLASQKLERVLERSSQLPTSPASLSHHHRSRKPTRKPEYEMPPVGARDQGATNAETDLEAGLGEAEVGPVEKEELTVAPSPPLSHVPGSEVRGSLELLSQTQETGEKGASLPKVGVPSANPFRLSRVPAEPAHTLQPSQSHKRDLSHWNKVKVLLNRIRWKSPQHPEPPAPPNGPAFRVESRDLPCRPLRKTFMPSLVLKKQRAKNLSVS